MNSSKKRVLMDHKIGLNLMEIEVNNFSGGTRHKTIQEHSVKKSIYPQKNQQEMSLNGAQNRTQHKSDSQEKLKNTG